jgi:transposase InsO family protein
MVVSGESSHRFLVHDHDSIYSEAVDRTLQAMGLTVLKTPVRSSQANAFCERMIGTIRRECLDLSRPLYGRAADDDSEQRRRGFSARLHFYGCRVTDGLTD